MSARMSDLKRAIEQNGEAAVEALKSHKAEIEDVKSENASLRERLEELESRASQPGKTGDGNGRPAADYKTYHTPSGKLYELPAATKMADVIGPAKAPEISFDRWLAATMAGDRCGDKEAVEFATERKQLTTTTSGVLIPEEFQSEWIDRIRAQMVLNAAGMATVTMDAKTLNASAVVTDPDATWHTEAGSISADNPTFAARTLTAQTLVTRCQGSLEVSQDSPDFGTQLANVMSRAMAVELDRVGLIGSGSAPEPQGILGTSGIGQVQGVGTPTDYSDLVTGVKTLLDANVPLDVATANVIMAPAVWETYENLPTGIASDNTQLPRPRSLANTAFRITSNITNTDSPVSETAFMGDFRDLVLGVRREATVESLKLTTYATNLLLEFVGYLRSDYLVRRPASFVTIEGIVPA